MNWTKLRRIAISLPLAILAGVILVSISELGYRRTNVALSDLIHTYDTRTAASELMEGVLNAETGLRGYLLTNDEKYLTPYTDSIQGLQQRLESIRLALSGTAQGQQLYSELSRSINRKTAEMDLSLRLFREGNSEALKFIMFTDMGNTDMARIRTLSDQLRTMSTTHAQTSQSDIQAALFLGRMGVATVTVIGLLAFYLYLRQSHTVERLHKREQALLAEERSRLEDLVRERTATLTELATHLQQVREDERGHLARELHDELGALLTAAKLDVARLKSRVDASNPEITERLKHLTDTLNSGIALKRRIIEDLRPSSLSNLGLCTSLEILTSEFSQRSGIPIEPSLEPVELPDATELTIYRLVQESLTNIGKYANASSIQLAMHSFPTYVAVQIQDDGQGFDPASIRPSAHGLSGMRHRVEAAGGRLTINSSPGNGTTISAIIPIDSSLSESRLPAIS